MVFLCNCMERKLINQALKAATEVRERAWAPYSNFKVGSALIDSEGEIHIGCNVENASYGLTQCAERSAITAATAAGKRNIECCVVVTNTPEPVTPCGACRQVLFECNPHMIVVCATTSGTEKQHTLQQLLPDAFVK